MEVLLAGCEVIDGKKQDCLGVLCFVFHRFFLSWRYEAASQKVKLQPCARIEIPSSLLRLMKYTILINKCYFPDIC